ncbi:hypothetical protein H5410_055906 [Solanum commersonii]|uniref:Uncharacterized protein n=1 Tax=Solanum commersonii TaxID=4109 RepID=A0A9J5WKR4_SOLCO|nr:hypothetical protein H5410_055906 [Solanum commersonii]
MGHCASGAFRGILSSEVIADTLVGGYIAADGGVLNGSHSTRLGIRKAYIKFCGQVFSRAIWCKAMWCHDKGDNQVTWDGSGGHGCKDW